MDSSERRPLSMIVRKRKKENHIKSFSSLFPLFSGKHLDRSSPPKQQKYRRGKKEEEEEEGRKNPG